MRENLIPTYFKIFQVNLFGLARITAEFVAGGIQGSWRIDAIPLFPATGWRGNLKVIAEFFFAVSTFYYMIK